MKCDELKPIDLECNMGKDINGVEHREPWKAYDIDDVDAAIAELKQKIEDAKATAYTDSVDAGMENRRLKRALWLARAWRAESVMEYLTMKCKYFEKSFSIDVPKCDVDLLAKWAKIIPKCRAKAEEYK